MVLGDDHGISSYQADATVLTRFGDLCVRYGTVADARHAYDFAIASEQGFGGDMMVPVVRNDTFNVVRSAAVAANDKNWVARAYRAEIY